MTEFDTINSKIKKLENISQEQERINKKRFAILRDELEILKAKFKWLEDYCGKEIKETDEKLKELNINENIKS